MIWGFYFGPALSLPFLAFPWVVRDRRMRFPLFAGAVFLLSLAVETWMLPHYFAPALGLLYLGLLQCMRHLRLWRWRGKPVGSALVCGVPLILCAMIIFRLTLIVAHILIEPEWPRGNVARAQIVRALHNAPGQHLILVRYGKTHVPDNEWVYNAADIDHAKLIWARDMGEHDNQELLQYFKDRKVWIVDPDRSPVRFESSSPPSGPAGAASEDPPRQVDNPQRKLVAQFAFSLTGRSQSPMKCKSAPKTRNRTAADTSRVPSPPRQPSNPASAATPPTVPLTSSCTGAPQRDARCRCSP